MSGPVDCPAVSLSRPFFPFAACDDLSNFSLSLHDGNPIRHIARTKQATSLNKLERSALKKKAHYEKQANAAAGAAIAAAALAAAAGATAAAHKQ